MAAKSPAANKQSKTVTNFNKTGNSVQSSVEKAISSAKKTLKETFNDNEAAKFSDTKLEKFFVDCLKDIYWAEKNLVKALPKMKKAATSTELKTAFEDHLQATEGHAARLEKIFGILGQTARAKKCEAMEGLIEESKTIIEETEAGTATRDVGLIFAAQKVEHYEIATYGGLAQLARTMGQDQIADILDQTLQEEKETDVLLTEIAENDVNYEGTTEASEDDAE